MRLINSVHCVDMFAQTPGMRGYDSSPAHSYSGHPSQHRAQGRTSLPMSRSPVPTLNTGRFSMGGQYPPRPQSGKSPFASLSVYCECSLPLVAVPAGGEYAREMSRPPRHFAAAPGPSPLTGEPQLYQQFHSKGHCCTCAGPLPPRPCGCNDCQVCPCVVRW